MKIKSLKIENLFEIFEYDISFHENENVLIITGPNGFGKTMILNIIFSLFNRQFLFFQKLVFDKITVVLDENITIEIVKKNDNENKSVSFLFFQNGKKIDDFDFSNKLETDIVRVIEEYLPVQRVASDSWIDHRTGRTLTIYDLINEYADQLPDKISKKLLRIKSARVNGILDSIQVHLIREQRLFKKAKISDRQVFKINDRQIFTKNYRDEMEQTIMNETIQTYSNELKQLISQVSQKSFLQTQELDSSYPNRLRSETDVLKHDEYKRRYDILKKKQQKLKDFGLYESKQEFLTYSKEDEKALSVYLKDFEIKLGVFDDLSEKLELFTNILNERRFTFKSVIISRDKGFFFKTRNGKDLVLNQLSSGEQHEVVLLYELIFNVKPNVMVLIDEPEISLHVSWQKEFLNDILKIIKIQNIQVVISTHSPSIINDRWDLTYNLPTPIKP